MGCRRAVSVDPGPERKASACGVSAESTPATPNVPVTVPGERRCRGKQRGPALRGTTAGAEQARLYLSSIETAAQARQARRRLGKYSPTYFAQHQRSSGNPWKAGEQMSRGRHSLAPPYSHQNMRIPSLRLSICIFY